MDVPENTINMCNGVTKTSVALLKEKIIKTDAVFNIVSEKNATITDLQSKLDLVGVKFIEKCVQLNSWEQKNTVQEKDIYTLTTNLVSLQAQYDNLSFEYNLSQTNHEEKANESFLTIQHLEAQLTTLNKLVNQYKSENEILQSSLKGFTRNSFSENSNRLETKPSPNKEYKSKIKNLEEKLGYANKKLQECITELESSRSNCDKLLTSLQENKTKIPEKCFCSIAKAMTMLDEPLYKAGLELQIDKYDNLYLKYEGLEEKLNHLTSENIKVAEKYAALLLENKCKDTTDIGSQTDLFELNTIQELDKLEKLNNLLNIELTQVRKINNKFESDYNKILHEKNDVSEKYEALLLEYGLLNVEGSISVEAKTDCIDASYKSEKFVDCAIEEIKLDHLELNDIGELSKSEKRNNILIDELTQIRKLKDKLETDYNEILREKNDVSEKYEALLLEYSLRNVESSVSVETQTDYIETSNKYNMPVDYQIEESNLNFKDVAMLPELCDTAIEVGPDKIANIKEKAIASNIKDFQCLMNENSNVESLKNEININFDNKFINNSAENDNHIKINENCDIDNFGLDLSSDSVSNSDDNSNLSIEDIMKKMVMNISIISPIRTLEKLDGNVAVSDDIMDSSYFQLDLQPTLPISQSEKCLTKSHKLIVNNAAQNLYMNLECQTDKIQTMCEATQTKQTHFENQCTQVNLQKQSCDIECQTEADLENNLEHNVECQSIGKSIPQRHFENQCIQVDLQNQSCNIECQTEAHLENTLKHYNVECQSIGRSSPQRHFQNQCIQVDLQKKSCNIECQTEPDLENNLEHYNVECQAIGKSIPQRDFGNQCIQVDLQKQSCNIECQTEADLENNLEHYNVEFQAIGKSIPQREDFGNQCIQVDLQKQSCNIECQTEADLQNNLEHYNVECQPIGKSIPQRDFGNQCIQVDLQKQSSNTECQTDAHVENYVGQCNVECQTTDKSICTSAIQCSAEQNHISVQTIRKEYINTSVQCSMKIINHTASTDFTSCTTSNTNNMCKYCNGLQRRETVDKISLQIFSKVLKILKRKHMLPKRLSSKQAVANKGAFYKQRLNTLRRTFEAENKPSISSENVLETRQRKRRSVDIFGLDQSVAKKQRNNDVSIADHNSVDSGYTDGSENSDPLHNFDNVFGNKTVELLVDSYIPNDAKSSNQKSTKKFKSKDLFGSDSDSDSSKTSNVRQSPSTRSKRSPKKLTTLQRMKKLIKANNPRAQNTAPCRKTVEENKTRNNGNDKLTLRSQNVCEKSDLVPVVDYDSHCKENSNQRSLRNRNINLDNNKAGEEDISDPSFSNDIHKEVLIQRFMSDIPVIKPSVPIDKKVFKRPLPKRKVVQLVAVEKLEEDRIQNNTDSVATAERTSSISQILENIDVDNADPAIEDAADIEISDDEGSKLLSRIIEKTSEESVVESVCNQLSKASTENIARLLVLAAYHHHTDTPQPSHTPLAPALSPSYKTIIGLMSVLSTSPTNHSASSPPKAKRHADVHTVFLSQLEQRLLQKCVSAPAQCTKRTGPPESVCVLYVAVCMVRSEVLRVRKAVCDMAYYQRDGFYPLLYAVFTVWPSVLPGQDVCLKENDTLLMKVIMLFVYKKRNSDDYMHYRPFLTTFATAHYKYKANDLHLKLLFDELVEKFTRCDSNKLAFAIIILFQRLTSIEVLQLLRSESFNDIFKAPDEEKLIAKSKLLWLLDRMIPDFQNRGEKAIIADLAIIFGNLQARVENEKVKEFIRSCIRKLTK